MTLFRSKEDPEIATVLVVSSEHITAQDLGFLLMGSSSFSCSGSNPIFINLDTDPNQSSHLSQEAKDLINWAKSQAADYLVIDSDGPVYTDLPRFDWE